MYACVCVHVRLRVRVFECVSTHAPEPLEYVLES